LKNKFVKFAVLAFVAIILFLPLFVKAQTDNSTTIYFFYGDGCPHCKEQEPFMKEMSQKYLSLNIVYLETWHNETNAKLLTQMFEAHKVKAGGVPATFIGIESPIVGYRDAQTTGVQIEQKIKQCIDNSCANPLDKLSATNQTITNQSINQTQINIPVIGNVDPNAVSLPIFTIIIAGLDSFNPCAFFILLFLLSILVYAGSRKKMLLVGGVFIFFSGLIYFLFMAAWLNVFLWTGEILWITMIAGAIAVIMSLINIKDFFYFKKGISLSISEKAKPKLFKRMRLLISGASIWSVLLGTVVLAVVANMYELLCTAGFPMVFTRMLTLNNLSTTSYYMYLLLYNLVYIIPLAVIVIIFTYTLGSRKLSEYEGRVLKLISGVMMLLLGLVLLLKPSILNNVVASIVMIVMALILSVLIVVVHKKFSKQKNHD